VRGGEGDTGTRGEGEAPAEPFLETAGGREGERKLVLVLDSSE